MLANVGLGGLAGMLGGNAQITPEQTSHVQSEHVEQMANQAQRQNPGIVREAANFYAQHPVLVQSLGAVVSSSLLGAPSATSFCAEPPIVPRADPWRPADRAKAEVAPAILSPVQSHSRRRYLRGVSNSSNCGRDSDIESPRQYAWRRYIPNCRDPPRCGLPSECGHAREPKDSYGAWPSQACVRR
jgi:hypothetical protein